MLSPYLVLKSAVGAVQDRHFIGKNTNKKLSQKHIDKNKVYYI